MGQQSKLTSEPNPISVVELDEMHRYIGSKKITVGYGLLLIDLQDGSSRLCVRAEEQKQV